MALMSHLAEVHISESFESYADDVTMRVLLMQSHLESTATAILHVKGMTQAKVSSVDEDGELIEHFAKQADALISHSRSAKVVAGKTVRSLEELKARSLSLTLDTSSAFERCQTSAQELAHYSRKIGEDLCELFSVEGRSDRYTYEEIQSTVQRTTNAIFNITQVDVFETFGNKLRTLSNNLADLGSMTSDLELTIEFERPPAPWVLRSQEIKSRKLISVDAEEEIRKLRDDVHERVMQLRIRDKSLEESAVKIELLEARTRDASKKADRINELERFVDTAKVRENELTEAIEVQKREIKSLGIDCQRWKEAANERQAFEPRSSDGNHPLAEKTTVATARETEALQREISTLQSTVRYLHEDNQKARLPDVSSSSSLAWLREPLVKPKTPQEESANRIKSEGQDVFHEMLNLVSDAKVVDLRSRGLQENKLGWRKRSETPAWQLMSQKEDWERWRQWRNEVVAKGRNVSRGEAPGTRKPVPRSAAPTIDFGSVGLGGEKFEGNEPLREVQIVDPEALQAT
ncbi:MAG: hypothetical protein M1837_005849 [Sclerophora amabilis]|nr:MAG: hypothetical protein M1837_005849 [Sclerophora amabilis]